MTGTLLHIILIELGRGLDHLPFTSNPATRTPSFFNTKCTKLPWLRGSVDWGIVPYTKRPCVQSPVRPYIKAAGLIPGWCVYGRQPINVSLTSLSVSLCLSSSPSLPPSPPYLPNLPSLPFESTKGCPPVKIFLKKC